MACLAWRLCGPETWSGSFDFLMLVFHLFCDKKYWLCLLRVGALAFGAWSMYILFHETQAMVFCS